MRILIYGLNYAPELVGIGKYTGEMSEWLSAKGCSVRVVTAPPYYPAWKVGAGFAGSRYSSELRNGAMVDRCPLWVPKKPSGLRRMLHLASFALSSLPVVLWRALTWRPDVIITVAPAFFCAPGGWLASKIGGSHAWLHIQDLELDAAFDLGLITAPAARGAATWIESLILKRFDRVSSISRSMLTQLQNKGVEHHDLKLFPNWVDTYGIFPDRTSNALRTELGIPADRVIALYSGNMGEKQGLDILIDIARKLDAESAAGNSNDRVEFVLCGDGSARAKLVSMAEGLGNVRFIPLQPAERFNELLNMADIHLLPQRENAADLVMPSKLTSILSCGGPVIATASHWTELARTVRDAGGIVCTPGDAQALSDSIVALAGDANLRKETGARAREYALNFLEKSMILGELLRQLEPLCKQREASSVESEAHSML